MSLDDAVFDATNSYTFTETIKFTTQQTQLVYTGTDSDPVASNIGDYISDIEVISHNYKLNGATLTTYITENETSFSGISAVASVTYSPFIVVATSNDELGCKFEVIGQGYNWFNGEVENNRDVDFS